MKLTALILLIGCLQVSARVSSQTLTFSGKNVPLEKVFAEIKSQTGFVVFFDYGLVRASKPVTINITSVPLRDALSLILKEQNLDFEIEGKSIVISKKEPTVPRELSFVLHGVVRDPEGKAIGRATIQVKGKPLSVATDDLGAFSIKVDPGDVLVISSVGFVTKEITIRNEDKVAVILQIKNQN